MDDNMAVMMKILDNLREKYKYYNEIYNLTKELEKVIQMNDEYSLASVLDMRERVMVKVDALDMENFKFIDQLPVPLEKKVRGILYPKEKSKETLKLDNPLETDLFDTNKSNIALLNRTITLDKKLNAQMNNRPKKAFNVRG